MDYLNLVKKEEFLEYTENLNYNINSFLGNTLFPKRKVADPIIRMRRIADYGNVPVIAKVHGLDTEALIGSRENFEEIKAEALLIKEKLPITERIKKMLGRNPQKSDVVDFLFDDANTLVVRNLTRAEVMNMELLCTGKVTINENNVKTEIDYKVPTANKIALSAWDNPTHDIIGDIESVIEAASKKGYKLTKAYTSSTILGYMVKNNAIKAYWASSVTPLTKQAMLTWLETNYGIKFEANDAMYKTEAGATTAYRFFDEQTITFVTADGALGEGVYGVTPEQEKLFADGKVHEKSLVTIMQWGENDPVEEWTKGSSLYLPVLKDANALFICKHTASI